MADADYPERQPGFVLSTRGGFIARALRCRSWTNPDRERAVRCERHHHPWGEHESRAVPGLLRMWWR